MAATCTITENECPLDADGRKTINTRIRKVTWDWTSHTDGSVSGVGQTTQRYHGFLISLETDPDGTDAPTDNYDITLLNEQGTDVLCGAGADRDTANNELTMPLPNSSPNPVALNGTKLDLNVANAGSGKKGRAVATILVR